MFSMLCSLIVIVCHGSAQSVVLKGRFPDWDYGEIVGFKRFVRNSSTKVFVMQSTDLDVEFVGEATLVQQQLSTYKATFFVQLVRLGSGRVLVEVPYTHVNGLGRTPRAARQLFSNGSIVQRSFDFACRSAKIPTRADILVVSYRLRPWLTDGGRRTELVDGEITYKRSEKTQTARIWFEASHK